MLQVDPKRRITVTQLLSHPWLTDGYDCPAKWQSKYHSTDLDMSVVEAMAAYKLVSPAQVVGIFSVVIF
jgi:serine/threonine protein kinase